jgi:hypothetical protein
MPNFFFSYFTVETPRESANGRLGRVQKLTGPREGTVRFTMF